MRQRELALPAGHTVLLIEQPDADRVKRGQMANVVQLRDDNIVLQLEGGVINAGVIGYIIGYGRGEEQWSPARASVGLCPLRGCAWGEPQ